MSQVNQPIVDHSSVDRLDGVLREFYHAEMPSPWPECKALEKAGGLPFGIARGRSVLSRSRFVLAASLLLLLSGAMGLSGLFSDNPLSSSDSTPGMHIGDHKRDPANPRVVQPSAPTSKQNAGDRSSR